jgi:hypothetical protein
MKTIIGVVVELTRLIVGTIIGLVLLTFVVSLCKFKDLCGKK